MSTSKTTAKAATPEEYIAKIKDKPRRDDMARLHRLIRTTVPRFELHMEYGMIGYGSYHYKYASGREGDWPVIALSNRAAYISLYVCASDGKKYVAEGYKKKLPTADIGKSCVRIKRLSDVDLDTIARLIREGARLSSTNSAGKS